MIYRLTQVLLVTYDVPIFGLGFVLFSKTWLELKEYQFLCHLCIVQSNEMSLLAAGKGLTETKCLALIVLSILKQLKPFL